MAIGCWLNHFPIGSWANSPDNVRPMNDLETLKLQLEEARDEAELNLLQLQQVQEELEFYFLRCQELDQQLQQTKEVGAAQPELASPAPLPPAANEESVDPALIEALTAERDEANQELQSLKQELEQWQQRHGEEQKLLTTAQSMLEGQARYLEDVSLREERAAQAIDRLRLLEAEISYYITNSRPLPTLDPERIQRLIRLIKQEQAAS